MINPYLYRWDEDILDNYRLLLDKLDERILRQHMSVPLVKDAMFLLKVARHRVSPLAMQDASGKIYAIMSLSKSEAQTCVLNVIYQLLRDFFIGTPPRINHYSQRLNNVRVCPGEKGFSQRSGNSIPD